MFLHLSVILFTGVSVQGGHCVGVPDQGGLCQGDLPQPPPYGYVRAVRILLECILVTKKTVVSPSQRYTLLFEIKNFCAR